MNGETIVYKKDWTDVKNVGITQGRQQEKALAKDAYLRLNDLMKSHRKVFCMPWKMSR